MQNRMVVKRAVGESADTVYIEDAANWQQRLLAWRQDHSKPCPMPVGHLMFVHPEQYGARRYSNPDQMPLFDA